MLKIVTNPEFTAEVKVLAPGERGQEERSFKVRFRALRRSEEAAFDATSAR